MCGTPAWARAIATGPTKKCPAIVTRAAYSATRRATVPTSAPTASATRRIQRPTIFARASGSDSVATSNRTLLGGVRREEVEQKPPAAAAFERLAHIFRVRSVGINAAMSQHDTRRRRRLLGERHLVFRLDRRIRLEVEAVFPAEE